MWWGGSNLLNIFVSFVRFLSETLVKSKSKIFSSSSLAGWREGGGRVTPFSSFSLIGEGN